MTTVEVSVRALYPGYMNLHLCARALISRAQLHRILFDLLQSSRVHFVRVQLYILHRGILWIFLMGILCILHRGILWILHRGILWILLMGILCILHRGILWILHRGILWILLMGILCILHRGILCILQGCSCVFCKDATTYFVRVQLCILQLCNCVFYKSANLYFAIV